MRIIQKEQDRQHEQPEKAEEAKETVEEFAESDGEMKLLKRKVTVKADNMTVYQAEGEISLASLGIPSGKFAKELFFDGEKVDFEADKSILSFEKHTAKTEIKVVFQND